MSFQIADPIQPRSDLQHSAAAEQALTPQAIHLLRSDKALRSRWDHVNKIGTATAAAGDVAHPTTTRAREAYDNARDHVARLHQAARDAGRAAEAIELAEAEAAVVATRAALDSAWERSKSLVGAMSHSRDAISAAASALNQTAASGSKPKHIATSLPKGHPSEIVSAQQKRITGLKAERSSVLKAPPSKAAVLAELIAELDGDAVLPSFSITAKGAQLRWPQQLINAEPRPGFVPTTADAAAMFAALNRDAIVEHLKGEVARKYRDVPLALDGPEKAKRLAAIDADIVAAERAEVEAILAASEAGVDLPFRKDTSPRALLSIA